MDAYEQQALADLAAWRRQVTKGPNLWDHATRGVQDKINQVIPEKVHAVVTAAMEKMTSGILTGSQVTTAKPLLAGSLQEREDQVRARIAAYRAGAAVEGGVAGAGGFLAAAADFPILIGIKIKLLYDIAALYGRDLKDFDERLYLLSIFQLAFSSARHRHVVYAGMADWEAAHAIRPKRLEDFDWRRFQQEYRDYIDLAKLAQMIPVVGAPIGAVVNFRLVDRLGETAMNAYRMRWFAEEP